MTPHERQVHILLQVPDPAAARSYFDGVVQTTDTTLEIRDTGDKGKGVFATQDIEDDCLVLHEKPLVGAQHYSNKQEVLACSNCFCFVGSIESQLAWRLSSCDGAGSIVQSLESGMRLPFTDSFPLPAIVGACLLHEQIHLHAPAPAHAHVSCPGHCSDEVYCSQACADAAWEQHHRLLCCGSDSRAEAPNAAGTSAQITECSDAEALQEFHTHANSTNDIFHVAARVLAIVILQAENHMQAHLVSGTESANSAHAFAALQHAWLPFSAGHKAVWWDCVAVPDDVSDEAEFREELRQLAGDSLELLTAALANYAQQFPALFDLRVWGSIIGMFELNNLGIVVPSPIERYLLHIYMDQEDDIPAAQRKAARRIVDPIRDALGDAYDLPCEGTAFYAVQSCINHSCDPNVHALKSTEDEDGSAVLLAKQPIACGEELTISYIDESMDFKERQAALRDYGFTCQCHRCCAHLAKGRSR